MFLNHYLVIYLKVFLNHALSNVLIPINQTLILEKTEIVTLYMDHVRPNFYHISDTEKAFGIEMLLAHKRFFSAIDVASLFPKVVPTSLLANLLHAKHVQKSQMQLPALMDMKLNEYLRK